MKKIINLIIVFIVVFLTLIFTNKTYIGAKELQKAQKEYYSANMDIEKIIKRKMDSILHTITLGMVQEGSDKKNLEDIKAKIIILKEQNIKNITYVAVIVAISLLLFLILDLKSYSLMLAFISLIMLIYGLFTPILQIVIHKNVDFLGDIILSYESKTIIGTILHLYKSGNFPVALVILLFSVLVPFIKVLSMLIVTVWSEFNIAKKALKFFKHLGKWSMLDVFVVALLLVYLSMGSTQNSYSQILNGLYIFLIYVFVSLITSISVERVLKNTAK